MENLKKIGKNKNKLRITYPKNNEILRKASVGFNFTGSYIKKSVMFLTLFKKLWSEKNVKLIYMELGLYRKPIINFQGFKSKRRSR